MNSENQLSLLKDLGAYWYNDPSVPQLFERQVIDSYIQKNRKDLPSDLELKAIFGRIESIVSSTTTVRKESETCSKIIEKLLLILGYSEKKGEESKWLFDEQRTLKEDDSSLIPDYCLFENSAKHEKANKIDDENYFQNVRLILEAKRLGKDLLVKSKNDRLLDDLGNDSVSTLSPLSQIRKYVRASGCEFGIVTNGNDWILVSKNSRNYLSTYHIRLFEMVQLVKATEDYSTLLYWWLIFSRHFLLEKESERVCEVKENTAHFTNSLEDDLKNRLSPVVIELLNEIYDPSNSKEYLIAHKEELIIEVVRFIYQILYIGSLEDRNLLPINNPIYLYRYSLKGIFTLISNDSAWDKTTKPTFQIYGLLSSLVKTVSSGCKELGEKNTVAEFGDINNHFVIPTNIKIEDKKLRPILLKILEKELKSNQMVSLRALDTIQFGNIYEHILRLEISFNARSGKFSIDNSEDKKFERSTAVYTPHHIVETMVSDLVSKIEVINWESVENLKLVDPCFGSGHFLIELARQFSQKILDSIDVADIPLRGFADFSISERRQLIQRFLLVSCIYGVDRGEACLDVAKYSIWLSTAMIGQAPLFLDLQLGTGSSLYGETDFNKVSPEDSRILKEISKIRNSMRKGFFSHGGSEKFKQIVSESQEKIEKISCDLSDNFAELRYGYTLTPSKKMDVASRQRPFFWLREFPEVFIDGGFTCYITNPPYDQLKKSPSTLKFINGESEIYRLAKMTDLDIFDYTELFENDICYREFQKGYKNLFEGFILLKNKILKLKGCYSLIVPNSILAGDQTALVRANLWTDSLHIIREYPEKDSVSKRVFRARKVACAIIFGTKQVAEKTVQTKFELYQDANIKTPTDFGYISKSTSAIIDSKNLPIVILDKWQKALTAGLQMYQSVTLQEEDIREGELNESFNQTAVSTRQLKNYQPIYGTNRIEFNYFNFYPKQDIVQYCNIATATKISKAKLGDFGKQRIAINGIAGTNDTRVLCASYLPQNTLVNSNINYLLIEKLQNLEIDHNFYTGLLNSFVYDKIIRIQKRTNHNSSAMIASLPILFSAVKKKIDMKSIENKTTWKLSEIREKQNEKFVFSSDFSNWFSISSSLQQEIGILKNELVYEQYCTLTAVTHLSQDEQNSLARTLGEGTLSVEDFLLKNEITGASARRLKDQIKDGQSALREIVKLETHLSARLNYFLAYALLEDEDQANEFLKIFGIKSFEIGSLKKIREVMASISSERVDEFRRWIPKVA